MCDVDWDSRNDFVDSPDIKIIGYQACFDDPHEGLFLFNHIVKDCGSTLALPVDQFLDMYTGPIYLELRKGAGPCRGLCLDDHNFEKCQAECRMAHIRVILNSLQSREL